ncbi:hypothetical protein BX600DRAFT_429863 [Xylariales sp. PMI_506]|nr:hypothetical protein BX600DRAFT_429863 [Xylariales sp. PMI_506]
MKFSTAATALALVVGAFSSPTFISPREETPVERTVTVRAATVSYSAMISSVSSAVSNLQKYISNFNANNAAVITNDITNIVTNPLSAITLDPNASPDILSTLTAISNLPGALTMLTTTLLKNKAALASAGVCPAVNAALTQINTSFTSVVTGLIPKVPIFGSFIQGIATTVTSSLVGAATNGISALCASPN